MAVDGWTATKAMQWQWQWQWRWTSCCIWGRAEQESCIGWLVLTVYGGAEFSHAWWCLRACAMALRGGARQDRKEKKQETEGELHAAKLLSSRFSASNKLEPRGTFLCLCKKPLSHRGLFHR